MTEPIHLPQLARAPEQTEIVTIQDWIADLNALTPVQGRVKVVHHGNFLQVEGSAGTIVTLTCDRCLQQYNHRLVADAAEMIWLQDLTEADVLQGAVSDCLEEADLVESLPPDGYFQPDDWIYQQLCLALPQRQLCDFNCPGIPVETERSPVKDYRWAKLADFKPRLENESS